MSDHDEQLPLEPSAEVVALLVLGFVRAGDKVLDVGCFQGDDAVYLQTAGCRVTGVDMSRTALAYARGLARSRLHAGDRPSFKPGRAPAVLRQLRAGSFSVVLDRLLFSNLKDRKVQKAYLAQVSRLLKPAGLFVLRAGLVSGSFDGDLHPNRDSNFVRKAGFQPVRWRREALAHDLRETRGAETFLSPARAGFHREAWFEVFEKQ